MKMAKPSPQDCEAAMRIMQILDSVDDGYFPRDEHGDFREADPQFFDQDDDEHCRTLVQRILAVTGDAPGCLLRVIGGMCGVILFEGNRIVDPDADVLALHPSLVRRETDEGEGLTSVINEEWIRLYGGEATRDPKALITRVRKIAEDRDCMLANWKASEAAYQKADKELKDKES